MYKEFSEIFFPGLAIGFRFWTFINVHFRIYGIEMEEIF
jgi:hypothetical protein